MLRLGLLGELTLEVDGTNVEPPAGRRARELLGWLALERGTHRRSALAARFWPDVLDESARTSLRSALSAVRRSLGPDGERYLLAGRESVGLAAEPLVATDLAEFERRVVAGRLEAALTLCRGELLADLDADWVYEAREAQRQRVGEVLAGLAQRAAAAGDLSGAVEYARRQAALDPLAEDAQRELMRRLAAAGDRAGAIRAYERLGRRLREELRMAPAAETRELAASLRESDSPVDSESPPPVAPSPAPSPAVVAFLVTDQVGSTTLLSSLGDEAGEQVRRAHFGLLREVASAHRGREVKNLGDGLVLAFSSVLDALACAIGIQQAVDRHNRRPGHHPLALRIGLHVGEPVQEAGDYFGLPVVVAKRLCDRAQGGQILASDLVRALAGTRAGLRYVAQGPLALKGIADPVTAWELAWQPAPEQRAALPAPFAAAPAAALIGRDAELARLHDSWQVARAGRGRVAVLVGEPGIGKTRLAADFCRAVHGEESLVLLGRCYEDSLAPYGPIVEALRHLVAVTDVAPPPRARTTLARLIGGLAGSDAEDAEPAPSGPAPPEQEQFRLFEAVAGLLHAAAAAQPVVLVLDDLHWADAPTVALLRHLVRVSVETPLFILGTYRGTEVDEDHPLTRALEEWRRARAVDLVALGGLDADGVASMISAESGRAAPAEVARAIADRTEGNPFFIEELLRDLDGDVALASDRIPDSVKDLLVRRLRRLDAACRDDLIVAAVIGREFELAVIATVTSAAPDTVATHLDRAVAAQAIVEAGIGRYSFAHALIRETIYGGLTQTRRAQLHRQVGEAIEALAGTRVEAAAGTLAHHFSAAGETTRAYRYHARAALAAERVSAVQSALVHLTQALATEPDDGAASGLEPPRYELLLRRGRLGRVVGDYAGAARDLAAALTGAGRARDRPAEMETLNELGILNIRSDLTAAAAHHQAALTIARELEDAAAQTAALDRLGVIATHQLRFDRALDCGEQALALARRIGDPVTVGRAMDSIKLAVWQLGDLARLEQLADELEPLWRERHDLWYLQWVLLESAFVPIGRARWAEGEERLAAARAINGGLRDPLVEVLLHDAAGWLSRARGAYDRAVAAGQHAAALGAEVGWEAWADAGLGTTLLDLHAFAQAADVLDRGLRAAEQVGAPHAIVRCLGQLAWARWETGQEGDARRLADRAEEMLDAVGGGPFLFGTYAYLGVARIRLSDGDARGAVARIAPLLDAAERSGWHELIAATALVHGLALERDDRPGEARAQLRRAAEVADAFGIPAPAWEAHAALARLTDSADVHLSAAAASLQRMRAGFSDESLVAGLRGGALAWAR